MDKKQKERITIAGRRLSDIKKMVDVYTPKPRVSEFTTRGKWRLFELSDKCEGVLSDEAEQETRQ